jgi:hypothetical protein
MHSFFTGLEHVLQVPKVHPMVNESRCHAAPWWQAWKWWRDVTDVT